MPRHHRPRRRARSGRDEPADSLARLRAGLRRTESRRGTEWNVQPLTADRAVKSYTCPGCGREIAPSTAHLVVWRADGVLGDAADVAARRHWHEHCWRIG